jgi:hypothetical protein
MSGSAGRCFGPCPVNPAPPVLFVFLIALAQLLPFRSGVNPPIGPAEFALVAGGAADETTFVGDKGAKPCSSR